MTDFDFDFGGVASAGQPLPEGEYVFTIEDATMQLANSQTSHNLKLVLVVNEPVEHNGRQTRETVNVQESTKPFVKAFMTALTGLDDEDIDNDTINNFLRNPGEMVGESIGGFIRHRVDGNRTYANVTSWFTA